MKMEKQYKVGGVIVTIFMLLGSMGYVYYSDGTEEVPDPTHICTGDKELGKCLKLSDSSLTCYTKFNETSNKYYGGKRCGKGLWEQLIIYENTPPKPELNLNNDCVMTYDRCT